MKTYDQSLDVSNPSARVPCVVMLDTSYSMRGEPIAELNNGVNRFFAEVRNDDAAAMSADIALVTFNSTAQVVYGFASAFDYPDRLEPFVADGQTATCAGVGGTPSRCARGGVLQGRYPTLQALVHLLDRWSPVSRSGMAGTCWTYPREGGPRGNHLPLRRRRRQH